MCNGRDVCVRERERENTEYTENQKFVLTRTRIDQKHYKEKEKVFM